MTAPASIAVAGATGFATSFVATTVLGLPRHGFVLAWAAAASLLWIVWARARHVHLTVQLVRHLPAGLLAGAAVGAVLAWTVVRQPGSPAPEGLALAADLLWLGLVYGSVDALILAVLPVVTVYAVSPSEPARPTGARVRAAAGALAASAIITAAYHLGFREFQGPQVILPVVGGVLTAVTYVLSGSAAAPILAHVIMHVTAVLHGAATTVQLPPHY